MGNSLHLCLPLKQKEESLDLWTYPPGRCLPEDRISTLPDDILSFILSFLPYKEVVKTSLLSHRWLNLWAHSLVLNVLAPVPKTKRINERKRRDYVKRVNRVIQRHKGQYLEEFRIVCSLDKRNQEDIDSWLEFALAKRVQRLELSLSFLECGYPDHNYVFPDPFLNSSSGGSRFLPSDLKCLKSLSLQSVDVTGEAIAYFLLNSPCLERLEVVRNSEMVELVISGPNSVLKYLGIKDCLRFHVLSISNVSLVSLDIPNVHKLTLTNLPVLVELSISTGILESTRTFSQASSCYSQLEALSITVYFRVPVCGVQVFVNFSFIVLIVVREGVMDALLYMCTNGQTVSIAESHFMGPDYTLTCHFLCFFFLSLSLSLPLLQEITELSNFDRLSKLKRLVIEFGVLHDENLTMLISTINYCPHLEEFVLMLCWYSLGCIGNTCGLDEPSGSSSLKSESLKVFEFKGFYGRVSDVELIEQVVDYAVCLEKIIIDPCHITLLRSPFEHTKVRRKQQVEAKSNALETFNFLRESVVPSHVDLLFIH